MPDHQHNDRDLRTPADRDLAGRRCVVTGGLGFIGSNVVHRLVGVGRLGHRRRRAGARARWRPRATSTASRWPTSRCSSPTSVPPRSADAVAGADVVFNVAGQVSHLASMHDPLRDLDLNVRSHLAFLETLRRDAPTAVVVQTSTRQVYGRPRYLPVDEDHPTAPVDVNGIDKLACEQLHLLYGPPLRACA